MFSILSPNRLECECTVEAICNAHNNSLVQIACLAMMQVHSHNRKPPAEECCMGTGCGFCNLIFLINARSGRTLLGFQDKAFQFASKKEPPAHMHATLIIMIDNDTRHAHNMLARNVTIRNKHAMSSSIMR